MKDVNDAIDTLKGIESPTDEQKAVPGTKKQAFEQAL